MIGTEIVTKAELDGHTLLGHTSSYPATAAVRAKLPAIAQSGAPGYEYYLWWGIFAPAGMSAERVAFINAAINKIVTSAEMKKYLDTQGAEPWSPTTAQLADLLPREIARYKKAAQLAKIQPQ